MKARWILFACLLLAGWASAAHSGGGDSPTTTFDVQSAFGEESAWTQGYLERAARHLVRWMDAPGVAPPEHIRVELKRDPRLGGIAGAAGPTALSFTSNVWPEERFRRWILAHELANLMACHYAGSGGFPSDWWSDGRSPFPEYASVLVMAHLGYVEDAAWRKSVHRGKGDHALFWQLHRKHGFDLFARFFALVRSDGVDLGRIGKTWPHADEVRSAYTIAYLSLAAGQNLADVVRAAGIGNEPSDWQAIHPDKPFTPYVVTPAEVQGILDARERLFAEGAGDAPADALARYRAGGAFAAR